MLGRVTALIRTNIVADFPSRNGYIYKETALLDLVRMSGQVNGMGGKIVDTLPQGDKTFLIWLQGQTYYDFQLRGFELVNGELAAIIDFGDDERRQNLVAHPFVITHDTTREDKVISKIDNLFGIILVRRMEE